MRSLRDPRITAAGLTRLFWRRKRIQGCALGSAFTGEILYEALTARQYSQKRPRTDFLTPGTGPLTKYL
jgi:hypothetical protein